MSKLIKILLSLNSLRKALGFGLFFNTVKSNYHLEIIEFWDLIGRNKILVLAPHPDDDVFGSGGTIRKIASSGGEVNVAYFCDGASGGKEGARPDQSLIEVRKAEARSAGNILGIKNQLFFGYQDGHLASSQAALRALSDLIKQIEPDIIFVPSFLDNHPDHRAANEILINCLNEVKHWPKKATWSGIRQIWAYEVWTPLLANRIVMINDTITAKKEAISKFKSQLMFRSYDKAILGLNEYRADINNQSGYAEAFFVAKPDIYQKLYRAS